MNPAEVIALFSNVVGGRDANNMNNTIREHTVISIINNAASVQDPVFNDLRAAITGWITNFKISKNIPQATEFRAVQRGGRRFNYDFDLILDQQSFKIEWKFGGKSVDSLPEFFNPAANKRYHGDESYARFFYRNYLRQVCDIYGIVETMSEEDYIARVHGTSRMPALFNALYRAEVNGTDEQKATKKQLVDQSIAEWLESVKDMTMIDTITADFKSSQSGKIFMIYSNGQIYRDEIEDSELTITSCAGVRLGKYLLLQSKKPGTTYEMLLRWKNHAGILYPAWQISMKRR